MRPHERMIRARYYDKLRSSDAVVEHFRVMHRNSVVVRTGDDKRWLPDFLQTASAVKPLLLLSTRA